MAKFIDLRQVLQSSCIIDAIQTIIFPKTNRTSYTMSKLPAGFRLNRFDSMMKILRPNHLTSYYIKNLYR